MLRTDVDRLSIPYPDIENQPDTYLRQRLAVECPQVDHLLAEIIRDMDPDVFGIGWWAPHPGTKRRILIGDCLFQALSSIGQNFVEGRLHLLELADWYEQENRVMADAVVRDDVSGEPRVQHPRPFLPSTRSRAVCRHFTSWDRCVH